LTRDLFIGWLWDCRVLAGRFWLTTCGDSGVSLSFLCLLGEGHSRLLFSFLRFPFPSAVESGLGVWLWGLEVGMGGGVLIVVWAGHGWVLWCLVVLLGFVLGWSWLEGKNEFI